MACSTGMPLTTSVGRWAVLYPERGGGSWNRVGREGGKEGRRREKGRGQMSDDGCWGFRIPPGV